MLDFLSILGVVALCVAAGALILFVIPKYINDVSEVGMFIYFGVVAVLVITGVVFYASREENHFDALGYIYEHDCRLTNRERGPNSTVVTIVNKVPVTTAVPGNLSYHYECRDGDFWR